MNFSEKLKEIRRNEGLSQEQLAEKIGVSRQAITKWETGKGLPDIENMAILAEIFNTTIDELVSGDVPRAEKPERFSSETIYDIDCEKHFDINIGSARSITLTAGKDEKLHVRLLSDTIENLPEVFKIKLDEHKNRLDVNRKESRKISKFQVGEELDIELILPEKYTEHCELAASVKTLEINGLNIRRLEYDGSAERVVIKNCSGSLEFTSKNDFEISADKVSGLLSMYQFSAKTLLHIPESTCPPVENKGRRCTVHFMKNGEKTDFSKTGGKDKISFSGIFSELTVDLK